jgi:DNA-binding NtrC family response regulator
VYGKKPMERITNGLNIKVFWNLKKKFLIIKIDMSKILIIEDEAAIRRVPKYFLREDTYQVEDAEDGVQGYEKIKNNDYDLVLCDKKCRKWMVELLEAVKK